MAGRKRVFVSYHYEKDKHYKNLLVAWSNNSHFDFHMRDESADISVDSNKAAVIKRVISTKINQGNCFLVIVGKSTRKCQWVRWEIAKARELKKKIVAVKLHRKIAAPEELYGAGAAWAYTFKLEAINNALAKV